jgi:hypothetical protein
MLTKLSAVAMMLGTLSYAAAGTTAIGTASARGDMRVDGYMVKGDATLFNGTTVETGQASVALRLNKGVEIKLSTGARGTFYSDRLVLQQGSSEWAPSNSFLIEANGLRVTPNEPNSRGMVSLSGAKTVEVAALTGGFRVTNERGLLLARVSPGHALSFGVPAAGAPDETSITITGSLTKEGEYYFLTVPETHMVYELTGKNLDNLTGKNVTIAGAISSHTKPAHDATSVVVVSSAKKNAGPAGAGMSAGAKAIIGTAIVGGAAGVGVGVYEANQPSTPASR